MSNSGFRTGIAMACPIKFDHDVWRSEEHTSELQSQSNLVCRLLLEKKKNHASHLDSHYRLEYGLLTQNYSRLSASLGAHLAIGTLVIRTFSQWRSSTSLCNICMTI